MKRLGIFVFYDKDGIVDDYVTYLLEDMLHNITRLVIVYNGTLSLEGRKKLEMFTTEIIGRPNFGFDATAWKEIILNYLGEKVIRQYDEIVLFNDTFYGPFYSFKEIFKTMEMEKCDFWGITIHSQSDDVWNLCEYGYLPEHIQSYFMVFTKRIIDSKVFYDYWHDLKKINDFSEAVCFNEARLTKYFSDYNFTYKAFCDTRYVDKIHGYSENYYAYEPYMLLKKFKCPLLKRKTVMSGWEWEKCSAYIERVYNYDINLIYQNIYRTGKINSTITQKAFFLCRRYAKRYFPNWLNIILKKIIKLNE